MDPLHCILLHRVLGQRGAAFARACATSPPHPPLIAPAFARERVSRQLAVMDAMDVSWVAPWQWPPRFNAIRGAAIGLFVRGNPAVLDRPAVAFVGARYASASAERWAWERAGEAAKAGFVVVSGGARGIDAAAHRGALDAGGVTVAFIGVGCDALYPAENRRLFGRILENGGAVVSEHPPGEGGRPSDHANRNRFIAAAARSLWVAEAGLRSGTLGTAAWAKKLDVPIRVSPPSVEGVRAGLDLLVEDGAQFRCVFEDSVVAASAADRYTGAAGKTRQD